MIFGLQIARLRKLRRRMWTITALPRESIFCSVYRDLKCGSIFYRAIYGRMHSRISEYLLRYAESQNSTKSRVSFPDYSALWMLYLKRVRWEVHWQQRCRRFSAHDSISVNTFIFATLSNYREQLANIALKISKRYSECPCVRTPLRGLKTSALAKQTNLQ